MLSNEKLPSVDLERNELHLSLFACSAIVILAAGLALLMYPAVFASRESSPITVPQVAFFGFCLLACLLVAYILDRQVTIHRLRAQIAADRKRASEALRQASADLLSTMPNFSTFEDRMTMEFRRAAAADLKLNVLVIGVKLSSDFTDPGMGLAMLGDAAKAASRKLREEDSLYLLRPSFFGVILPGVGLESAARVSDRLSEGLSDAAGASERFTFKIERITYPEQTSSAHDLELVVSGWLPEDDTKDALKDSHVY